MGDVVADSVGNRTSLRSVLWLVAGAALATNALSMASTTPWVCPDTSWYVELAGGIADRGDFAHELFLVRPPGYPLLLAGVFRLFGGSSPVAVQAVQHLCLVGVALLTALIAWEITGRRTAALLAGMMSALSLQLLAFANVIVTEAPFSLAMTASVYFAVRFQRRCGGGSLAMGSLFAGVSYLFRPIGMTLVGVCVAAALLGPRRRKSPTSGAGRSEGHDRPTLVTPSSFAIRSLFRLSAAALPAVAVVAPAMVQNLRIHGSELSARCADVSLYHRILVMDRLDSDRSAALTEIKDVVHEAVAAGVLPANADHRQWGTVWQAYQQLRGATFAQASTVMGRAARDLVREHPRETARNTGRYCLWMLMRPDASYRFLPDGAPGLTRETGESIRDASAETFSITTYEPMLRRWIEPYGHHLPLTHDARPAAPVWSALVQWFYRNVECGPSIGAADSPYEAFTWFCIVAAGLALLSRRRGAWVLVVLAIALQVSISSFLAGPTPRYAVPVKPLLMLFPAWLVTVPFGLFFRSARSEPAGSAAPPQQSRLRAVREEAARALRA